MSFNKEKQMHIIASFTRIYVIRVVVCFTIIVLYTLALQACSEDLLAGLD
jgi:hypothetical protein